MEVPLAARLLYEAAMKEITLHPEEYMQVTHNWRLRAWGELDEWERLLVIGALRRFLSTHDLKLVPRTHICEDDSPL